MKLILIVDDIEENLYLLRALMEGHGYQVVQARNGSEAIAKALAILPDMIISDILMPEMDGFTLCRFLKKDDRLKHIPFVFYTATYTDPKDEKLALDMGADAFIIKPTEPEDFLRQVENILNAFQDKGFVSRQQPPAGEEVVLKEYNEALIRKLEHKTLGLEQTNKALEAEIMARKKAEADLRDSEERYRSLFENSLDGVLLTVPHGDVLEANPEACRIFGMSEEEICAGGREGLVDRSDPKLEKALEERDRRGSFTSELTCLRKDGTRFPCEISSTIFKNKKGQLRTCMIIRDVTGRKKSEDAIQAALQEKDVLIKEIHHRVKNNMQVISSMIGLHLNPDLNIMKPDNILTTACDLQNRIKSMALVHEMLYRSQSLSKIDFNEYLHNLVDYLFNVFNIDKKLITPVIEATDEPITITTALPLGQIITELLTNALKFAFPSGRKGEITIKLSIGDDGVWRLTVRDNGIGLPENFDIYSGQAFGMRLVSLLIRQLEGTLSYRNDNGAFFTISCMRRA